MSWKDNPLGGASQAGTGFAQGAMQGMAINNLNRAVDSWQEYAAKLEERLRQTEEGQAKWRAVAVDGTAQAIMLGKYFEETVGERASERLGIDAYNERVDTEKEAAEEMAETNFSKARMVR